MNYIGIDIGTTNIKIIEVDSNFSIKNKKTFSKCNPNTALEKFIKEKAINIKNIKKIIATGVKVDKLNKKFKNIEVIEIPEFIAIANGGKYAQDANKFIVASIGTGTAIIKYNNGKIEHAGGTGVGGGTLVNLCKRIIPNITFKQIYKITKEACLENVDLWIKDVTDKEIKTLPKDITAVNLGKLNNNTNDKDLVLGIINMIFETVGVMVAFVAKEAKTKKIVAIGKLVNIPFAREVFNKIELLHNVEIIIPENPEYIVAQGAVKSYLELSINS